MTRPGPGLRATALLGALTLGLTGCGAGHAPAGEAAEAAAVPRDTGNGQLVIGALLPRTGDFAAFGPVEAAALQAAVRDINAAGGVLGHPVRLLTEDSGDGKPDLARPATRRLIRRGADVIVNGGSSAVSLSMLDVAGRAGVVVISPSASSSQLETTAADPHGLFFSTTPSDVLEASVLADQLLAEGHRRVAVLARDDTDGIHLADELEADLVAGGGEVTAKVLYPPHTDDFTSQVAEVKQTAPGAVVVVGFHETEKILADMIRLRVGPGHQQLWFTGGNTVDYSEDFPAGTLTGVEGTRPGKALPTSFRDELLRIHPGIKDFTFGAETYDAVVLAALAAQAARTDDPARFARDVVPTTRGGRTCTTFKQCSVLAGQGADLDYAGPSGSLDLTDTGSPDSGTVTVIRYAADNSPVDVTHVTGPAG
jgi:branched-chain amino acid transport system substrate-binding protein